MINKVWESRLCVGKSRARFTAFVDRFLCLAQSHQGVILHERYEDSRRTLALHPVYGMREQRDIFEKLLRYRLLRVRDARRSQ